MVMRFHFISKNKKKCVLSNRVATRRALDKMVKILGPVNHSSSGVNITTLPDSVGHPRSDSDGQLV